MTHASKPQEATVKVATTERRKRVVVDEPGFVFPDCPAVTVHKPHGSDRVEPLVYDTFGPLWSVSHANTGLLLLTATAPLNALEPLVRAIQHIFTVLGDSADEATFQNSDVVAAFFVFADLAVKATDGLTGALPSEAELLVMAEEGIAFAKNLPPDPKAAKPKAGKGKRGRRKGEPTAAASTEQVVTLTPEAPKSGPAKPAAKPAVNVNGRPVPTKGARKPKAKPAPTLTPAQQAALDEVRAKAAQK